VDLRTYAGPFYVQFATPPPHPHCYPMLHAVYMQFAPKDVGGATTRAHGEVRYHELKYAPDAPQM